MNIGIKEDRRVRKTKKALREGLAELLTEKDIQNITVRELTDRVDIHRSTFYANFQDIYELYHHMEDVVLNEISNIVSMDCNLEPKALFQILLEYVSNNRQICLLLFSKNVNAVFFNRLTNQFKDLILDAWCQKYNLPSITKEMEYYAQFCLSGSLGIIGKWVVDNFEHPTEKLVNLLMDIDSGFEELVARQTVLLD